MKIKSDSKLLMVFLFIVLGLAALQLPISTLIGSRVKFTIFDLFAPTWGVFLGVWLGIVSVLVTQVVNLLIHGLGSIDKGSVIRLVPTLFGVWFFAKKEGRLLILPALAIVAFNLHPVGRTVWFYSLFWTIPFILWPLRDRFLVARALGATFCAHAVGGAIWIWAFNLPANIWISLIPIVALERSIFALGISSSYIFSNNLLALLKKKKILTAAFSLDKNYLPKFLK